MPFVIDASATLPWCFRDETTPWTESLLDLIKAGDRAIVPAHWPVEVSNGLLMAVRRKRVESSVAIHFWDNLAHLRITIEPPLTPAQAKSILTVAEQHRLTFYDAAYLDLAHRLSFPLASLDDELNKAASLAGVTLVS